jgi:hypothetical protein
MLDYRGIYSLNNKNFSRQLWEKSILYDFACKNGINSISSKNYSNFLVKSLFGGKYTTNRMDIENFEQAKLLFC